MTQQAKWETYQTITLATVTVMTCAAVFFIVVYYMQHTSNLDGFDFDVKTVTVQDYTVEMDISNEMWQDFLDNHYEKQRELPSS